MDINNGYWLVAINPSTGEITYTSSMYSSKEEAEFMKTAFKESMLVDLHIISNVDMQQA